MFANKLTDLDDFLTPAVECIKPLQRPNQSNPKDNSAENQPAKIDLSDDLTDF